MATVGGDYRGHRRLSVFRSARVNRLRAALPLLVLYGGERHESLYLAALLAGGCGCGGRLFARRHNGAIIPRRRDQRPDDRHHAPFDRHAYRARNLVERLINRLKQHRRLATRYETRAEHFLAMLTLAALLLWLDPV